MWFKVPEIKITQKTKIILVVIHTVFFIGCVSHPEAPQWYVQQQLIPEAYEYLGYGVGSTLEEAEAGAKEDIAYTLKSYIQSSSTQSIMIKNKDVQELVSIQTSLTSDITLSNTTKKKVEHNGGKYYVAYSYLNIPLGKKIKNAFSDTTKCSFESHPYLNKTPLFKEISSELVCLPKLSISQRHNQFYLNFEQHSFPLSAEDKIKLFTTVKTLKLGLKLSRNVINSGMYYHIDITPTDSGYLSLVQLYDDGTVQLLFSNLNVSEKQAVTYPSLNNYHGLEAYNAKSTPIQDLTLAIQCEEPIDIIGLPTIGEHISASRMSFFNYLMDISKDCAVAAQTQIIEPAI